MAALGKKSLRGGVLEITLTTFGFHLNTLNHAQGNAGINNL